MLALYLGGWSLNILVFIGLIMLAGIVVNNAIVLVDYINSLRRIGRGQRACGKSGVYGSFSPHSYDYNDNRVGFDSDGIRLRRRFGNEGPFGDHGNLWTDVFDFPYLGGHSLCLHARRSKEDRGGSRYRGLGIWKFGIGLIRDARKPE